MQTMYTCDKKETRVPTTVLQDSNLSPIYDGSFNMN